MPSRNEGTPGLVAVLPVVVAVLLGACSSEVPVRSTGASPTSTVTVADVATTVPAADSPPSTTLAAPDLTAPGIPDGDGAVVEDVVDGDTIVVSGGTRARLIGVDTPETKDPRKPVQCFGAEASAYTSSLLATGTPVRLVYDVERLDRYGRTLAYVYRESDGLFVNAALAADGYAVVATYPPNVAHTEELTTLAREAREAGRGLWSACGDEEPSPGPAAPPGAGTPAPVAGGSGGSGCDPSYPDVCIPSGPPDLDCGDVAERRFRVLPPDPHRFDGSDDDGLGCEG